MYPLFKNFSSMIPSDNYCFFKTTNFLKMLSFCFSFVASLFFVLTAMDVPFLIVGSVVYSHYIVSLGIVFLLYIFLLLFSLKLIVKRFLHDAYNSQLIIFLYYCFFNACLLSYYFPFLFPSIFFHFGVIFCVSMAGFRLYEESKN